jgi:propionate catabolism operon transcriptional regulator
VGKRAAPLEDLLMARVRILLVGYRKFSELINSILPEYEADADITLIESVASSSVDYQALVATHRPDVVASAGSNATYLQNTLKLPVIAQPVTAADVVDALARARRIGRRISLFTYEAQPELSPRLFRALPGLTDGELVHETYSTTDEALEKLLATVAQASADVVVGPSYICHLAEQRGLATVLLYSKESARWLLDEALRRGRPGAASDATAGRPARFVIHSPQMARVADMARTYARGSAAVLLQGESGTGKEHIAREIHRLSSYAEGELVALNCASIPNELFESELFGYVDGAFTSSRRGGRTGLLEQANGGVLFLDEIGEMPLAQQVKLLRVLQERRFRPVGGTREIAVDFKVIAATNADLSEAVTAGAFRDDLYYRLNVFNLRLPPLRERPEDIEAIAEYYLGRYAVEYEVGVEVAALMGLLLERFRSYSWPGNVRELQNFAERLIVNVAGGAAVDAVGLQQILPELFDSNGEGDSRDGGLKAQELRAIREAMVRHGGDKTAVSRELGISATTLWRRLKEMEQRGGTAEPASAGKPGMQTRR